MFSTHSPRFPIYAIARKVSDIRHYPPGTDKAAAREIRKKEKRVARKRRQKLSELPRGYGGGKGQGIFPLGSPERTIAERDAYHSRIDPAQRKAALEFAGMLSGGKADMLLHTLRARWLERQENIRYKQPFVLAKHVAALYDSLINEILLCDSLYYAPDPKPRVSDAQYDELVMHLLELERCFPELIQPRSPTQHVGHGAAARAIKLALENEIDSEPVSARNSFVRTVSVTTKLFPQHRHKALMLSLDNAYKHDDLVAFIKRATDSNSVLSAELKIDGVALSLEYRKRKLHIAATRGTGRIGDEITKNVSEALLQRGIPRVIDDPDAPDWLLVRGEVYISLSDFAVINSELTKPLSNARNAAAGALKHKDPTEAKARRLRFIAYECLKGSLQDMEAFDSKENNVESLPPSTSMWGTQEETLQHLSEWGFGMMPKSAICTSVEDTEKFAMEVENERGSLDMEVDGIVFKFNDSVAREEAGHTARAPRGAVAYKFAAQSRLSTILDVAMQVSRTGLITPVAILDPILIGGATLSRATLHNFDEVRRLGVAIGDTVRVERGGDVIPKVLNVEKECESPTRVMVAPPESCPSCGGDVSATKERNGTTYVCCVNKGKCNSQTLGRVIHFASRNAMDITGLGKKTAQKLVEIGLISSLADVFRMTLDDILSLEGFANKSSASLCENIQVAATSRSLEQLIVGIGLPTVGRTSAHALALKVESIRGLLDIGTDERGHEILMGVPNIAEKSAGIIHEHLKKTTVQSELNALSLVVKPRCLVAEEDIDEATVTVATISAKCFVFTGKFEHMSRPAVMKWIKKSGGRVTSDVSRKTDFIIAGSEPGNKYFKAQRLGIKTVQETEFFELFQVPEEDRKLLIAAEQK